jgi:hypothetical protein
MINQSFNFSGHAPAPIMTETLSVKELCYNLAGSQLLIMILILIAINFLAGFYYKKLDQIVLPIAKKNFKLLFFLPIINYTLLIWMFVYAWNLF